MDDKVAYTELYTSIKGLGDLEADHCVAYFQPREHYTTKVIVPLHWVEVQRDEGGEPDPNGRHRITNRSKNK